MTRSVFSSRPFLIVGGVVLAVAGIAGVILIAGNRAGEVLPSGIYRSSQPSPERLRQLIEDLELRTVVNLRGAGDHHEWLRTERSLCADLQVAHATVPGLNPDGWPPQQSVRQLVGLLKTAPRPLLLHCYRGADRAGWASAVARALEGDPLDRAVGELSVLGGHLCRRSICPLHLFFAGYRQYLENEQLSHSTATFRSWAMTHYTPDPVDAAIELLDDLPATMTPGQLHDLRVRVVNLGGATWRMNTGDAGVRLGVRAIGPYQQLPDDPIAIFRTPHAATVDLGRAGLEAGAILSGEERVFELRFRAPTEPGLYVLQIDMVDELVHWFSDLAGPAVLQRVEVIPEPS